MTDTQLTRTALQFTSLNDIDGNFKRVRPELDTTACGINARIFEPGQASKPHWHTEQDEVFFVHRGAIQISIDGSEWRDLTEGAFVRIAPNTPHAIRNNSDAPATVILLGGANGVVEGDAQFVEDGATTWSSN